MPWLRSGDNAATYPALLDIEDVNPDDDRLLNEVAGWLWRCSMQSAGHLTDGQINWGTAKLMAGGNAARARELIGVATKVGLLGLAPGSTTVWQLIDDPEFIHIRSKESVEWDRQRDRDRKNPALTAPVRARDGDACRYCGLVVNYKARTGARAGTYTTTTHDRTLDHQNPGQAGTVDTTVVCCRSCNSKMADGERLDLLPPPATPFFHPATLDWLHDHGHTPASHRSEPARAGEGLTPGGHRRDTARPTPARDTASERDQDPAADHGATPAPQHTATPDHPPAKRSPGDDAAASWVVLEGHVPEAPARDGQEPPGSEGGIPDGTGRDGQGRGGSGRGGAGAEPPRRRRGRRGRRNRKGDL